MFWAAQKGHVECVKVLLEKGANIDIQNRVSEEKQGSVIERKSEMNERSYKDRHALGIPDLHRFDSYSIAKRSEERR